MFKAPSLFPGSKKDPMLNTNGSIIESIGTNGESDTGLEGVSPQSKGRLGPKMNAKISEDFSPASH
jgi:hypothetical protein